MGEIKKQSISNFFFSYLGAALGFLITYIQPNLIPASDIGLLRLLYSFSWLAAIGMPFGMASITLRFFPRIRDEGSKHHGFFALLSIISCAGAFIVAGILYLNKSFFTDYYKNSPEFPAYFNEALVFAYILSLISIYTVYSTSLLKTTFTVFLTDVFVRLGQLLLIIVYHYQIINKDQLVLGYIGIFLVQLILLLVYLKQIKAISFAIDWSFFKTLPLKEMTWFGILMMFTAFASLAVKFIDQLMIGHFLNEQQVGIYATAVMICVIMEIPFNSLERIAQPKIAHAWTIDDRAEVEKIYEMSSRYMFYAGAVLFCLLWAGLDFIFMFLPPEYQAGKMAFYVASLSSLCNLLTGVNSSVIIMSHKYFATSVLLFLLMAVSFAANYWLIPQFGITGAAMALLIAISLFNLLKYLYILLRFKMQPFSRHTLYIFIGLLACTAFNLLLPSGIHPFFKAALGGGFTILVFTIMNIKSGSVEEVNKVLKRFKVMR